MTQLSSDKFNVAWFKLAEFVARKEKERALGVYRLLAHSLPDEAFAAQLEGDLLLAFNDEKALDSYKRAARLYEVHEKLFQAAAVYEHIIVLLPEVYDAHYMVIKVYEKLSNKHKYVSAITRYMTLLLKNSMVTKAVETLKELNLDSTVYEEFLELIKTKNPELHAHAREVLSFG